jgi:hypothetical protein
VLPSDSDECSIPLAVAHFLKLKPTFVRFFAIFSGMKQFSPFRFLTLDRLEGTAMRRVLYGRAGF